MMTSDEKTVVPALLKYIRSDLFAFGNLSKNVKLTVPSTTSIITNDTLIETDTTNPSMSWWMEEPGRLQSMGSLRVGHG